MIDIHTHILPEMDDGAESMEDALTMADMAVQSGVDTLIVTPHCNAEGIFENYYDETYLDCYRNFEYALQQRKLPLTVLPGMEVYASEEVPELLNAGKLITLNHSRYLLIEFNFYEDTEFIEYLLWEILKAGYHPIVAHPERYPLIQRHPELVYGWLKAGASIQVNKGSLLGSFGYLARDTALELLEHRLAAVIASDAHSPYRRTTDLSEVYHMVQSFFGTRYTQLLFYENPRRIVHNLDLLHLQMHSLF